MGRPGIPLGKRLTEASGWWLLKCHMWKVECKPPQRKSCVNEILFPLRRSTALPWKHNLALYNQHNSDPMRGILVAFWSN